jgi:hypothetical protein
VSAFAATGSYRDAAALLRQSEDNVRRNMDRACDLMGRGRGPLFATAAALSFGLVPLMGHNTAVSTDYATASRQLLDRLAAHPNTDPVLAAQARQLLRIQSIQRPDRRLMDHLRTLPAPPD